jgi:hypothetical protein
MVEIDKTRRFRFVLALFDHRFTNRDRLKFDSRLPTAGLTADLH